MESIRENQTYHDEYPEENKAAEINFNKTQNRSTTTANVPMENYCSVILFFRIRVKNTARRLVTLQFQEE